MVAVQRCPLFALLFRYRLQLLDADALKLLCLAIWAVQQHHALLGRELP